MTASRLSWVIMAITIEYRRMYSCRLSISDSLWRRPELPLARVAHLWYRTRGLDIFYSQYNTGWHSSHQGTARLNNNGNNYKLLSLKCCKLCLTALTMGRKTCRWKSDIVWAYSKWLLSDSEEVGRDSNAPIIVYLLVRLSLPKVLKKHRYWKSRFDNWVSVEVVLWSTVALLLVWHIVGLLWPRGLLWFLWPIVASCGLAIIAVW